MRKGLKSYHPSYRLEDGVDVGNPLVASLPDAFQRFAKRKVACPGLVVSTGYDFAHTNNVKSNEFVPGNHVQWPFVCNFVQGFHQ